MVWSSQYAQLTEGQVRNSVTHTRVVCMRSQADTVTCCTCKGCCVSVCHFSNLRSQSLWIVMVLTFQLSWLMKYLQMTSWLIQISLFRENATYPFLVQNAHGYNLNASLTRWLASHKFKSGVWKGKMVRLQPKKYTKVFGLDCCRLNFCFIHCPQVHHHLVNK